MIFKKSFSHAVPGVILGWHEIPGCVHGRQQSGRKRVIEEKHLLHHTSPGTLGYILYMFTAEH